jgi:hypothetical protein
MAMGTGPMTADIWEAMIYASALTMGTIADTVPNPIEVSKATSSAHPNVSTGRTYLRRWCLLHERGQVVQTGDLRVEKSGPT